MSRYKTGKYQQYTYDPQSQVDKCLECSQAVTFCNHCSANPKAKHRVFLSDKVEALWREGMTDSQTAEQLGTSYRSVRNTRCKLGLPPNREPRKDRVDGDEIARLWRQGLKDREIAEAMGCHILTVTKYRKDNDLPAQCRRGEKE